MQIPGNITQVDGTYISSDDDDIDDSEKFASSASTLKKAIQFPIEIRKNKVLQLDGVYDTSDDDEDDDDDDDLDDDDDEDDDENDDKDEEDNDEGENGVEEVCCFTFQFCLLRNTGTTQIFVRSRIL